MIETSSEKIWLTDANIMYYEAKPIEKHTIEHAIENINAAKSILNDSPAALSIIDIRKAKHISIEARNHYTSAENKDLIKACALITDSPLSRILGNFFMGLNKTPFPTKILNSEEKALEWLSTHN